MGYTLGYCQHCARLSTLDLSVFPLSSRARVHARRSDSPILKVNTGGERRCQHPRWNTACFSHYGRVL